MSKEGGVRSQLDNFVNDVPKICIRMICITYFFHESEIWSLQEELQPSVNIEIVAKYNWLYYVNDNSFAFVHNQNQQTDDI